jgi:restriction system protein
VKDKGIWTITEAGQAAHAELPDPEAFYKRACKLYAEWKAAQPDAGGSAAEVAAAAGAADDVENNAKAVSVTFEKAEEQAWAEVSQYLRAMNPYDFQDLVADLLRAMSYHVNRVSPPGKDGHPGLARCPGHAPAAHQGAGEAPAAGRERRGPAFLHGVLGDDDVGLFACTGGSTKDAEAEARTQEKRRITLISLEKLFDLWGEHYDKLSDRARRRLPLRSIRFLAPGG